MANDEVIIDLQNYKDRVGSRVVPGRYNVVVDDAESDTARSGNPMINLWYIVVDGDSEGATIIDRLVITDKSLFRVVGFMQALGIKTPKKRLKINPQMFVGKRLSVDVDDGEPYNGRVKSEIKGYLKYEGKKGTAAGGDLDDLDDLDATTGAADPDASPEVGDNEFTSDTTDTSAQQKKKDTTGPLADAAEPAEESTPEVTVDNSDGADDDDDAVEIDLDTIEID